MTDQGERLEELESRLNDRNDMQHEYTAWTVAIEAIALARSLEALLIEARNSLQAWDVLGGSDSDRRLIARIDAAIQEKSK